MTTGKNKKWLMGSRVWAEWRLMGPPVLYDFVGENGGFYWFTQRATAPVTIGKNITQLLNTPNFRPFLISMDKMEVGKYITEEWDV